MTHPKALAHESIYVAVLTALADEPRGRILDVPAGEGALAQRLVGQGFDVVCADLYPEVFKLNGVTIKKGDLDDRLPFPDGTFDHIVCVEGLEHIENPSNAVREFSRLLRTRGTLVVSVPNIMNIEERLKWVLYGYTSHFKPLSREAVERVRAEFPDMEEIALHVNPIGYSEIRFLLENNGFAMEGLYPDKPKRNTWAYWPVSAAIRLVGRLNSRQRRQQRWTDELNSKEVLTGGNTLIFKARKL